MIADGARMWCEWWSRGSCRVRSTTPPLHLFSAVPELVDFGRTVYRQRSEQTSRLMWQLLQRNHGEDSAMSFTMEAFKQWYLRDNFKYLTLEEQRKALEQLSPEQRQALMRTFVAGLSDEEIRQYREQPPTESPPKPRKPRRKK
jgi:hypothetical protein